MRSEGVKGDNRTGSRMLRRGRSWPGKIPIARPTT